MTDPVSSLVGSLLRGERRTLARLVTLAESALPEARQVVHDVLCEARRRGAAPDPVRFALTGPPGAGKSTLIESLGRTLVAQGKRFAVLTLDPSSPKSGGSLLGDRTRMPTLSQSEQVFIRSSPSRGNLGGVALGTALVVELCEWAGYDPVIIETVGVGQSEGEVRDLVECVVLVLTPDAGDDLQGMKRGITELCDLVVVNKSDLSRARAELIQRRYQDALSLLSGADHQRVLLASAEQGTGIAELWHAIQELTSLRAGSLSAEQRRARQLRSQLRRALQRRFEQSLEEPEREAMLARAEQRIERGELGFEEAVVAVWEELR